MKRYAHNRTPEPYYVVNPHTGLDIIEIMTIAVSKVPDEPDFSLT